MERPETKEQRYLELLKRCEALFNELDDKGHLMDKPIPVTEDLRWRIYVMADEFEAIGISTVK